MGCCRNAARSRWSTAGTQRPSGERSSQRFRRQSQWKGYGGVMCGRPQERKRVLTFRRSVECRHVFGRLMQLSSCWT